MYPVWQRRLPAQELGQLGHQRREVLPGLHVQATRQSVHQQLVKGLVAEVQHSVVGARVVQVVLSGADEGGLRTDRTKRSEES